MAKGKLKPTEVRAALAELALDPDLKEHVKEVLDHLEEEEYQRQKSQRTQVLPMNGF
jgi:hypothetical protein